jgi:hypothetical protein
MRKSPFGAFANGVEMQKVTHLKPKPRRTRPPKKAKSPEQFLAAGLTLAMLPPLPFAQRAPRRIVTRSGYRVRGLNLIADPSSRLEWESPPEANVLVMLGMCKSVDRTFSQPCVLEVEGTRYTPDFLVILRGGQRVWIECKHDVDRLDQEMERKLGFINALFRGVGDRFVILDRGVLGEDSPLLDNYRFLAGWRDLAAPEVGSPWPASTYGELVGKHGAVRVNAALAAGNYRFDMTQPLGNQTPVSPCLDGAAYELAFLHS